MKDKRRAIARIERGALSDVYRFIYLHVPVALRDNSCAQLGAGGMVDAVNNVNDSVAVITQCEIANMIAVEVKNVCHVLQLVVGCHLFFLNIYIEHE